MMAQPLVDLGISFGDAFTVKKLKCCSIGKHLHELLLGGQMLEQIVDLWTEPADAKCITTNGFIKHNGEGVMGAGVAGQAQARYPNMPKMLGLHLQENGNHVGVLQLPTVDDPTYYVAYPVKDVWMNPASEEFIVRSAHELMDLIDLMHWDKVLLPRPGCGNGRRVWGQVKRWIEPILDDRVIVIGLDDPFKL